MRPVILPESKLHSPGGFNYQRAGIPAGLLKILSKPGLLFLKKAVNCVQISDFDPDVCAKILGALNKLQRACRGHKRSAASLVALPFFPRLEPKGLEQSNQRVKLFGILRGAGCDDSFDHASEALLLVLILPFVVAV